VAEREKLRRRACVFASLCVGFTNMQNTFNDIVNELIAEGMELKRETAIDVITRFNRKCVDLALSGHSVNTGLVNMHATIRGSFYDKKWDDERNRLRVSITQGTDLRRATDETEVNILGEQGELIALFGITDLSTGKTDGTLTRGFNAELRGTMIRIAGNDPTVGLWLRNLETGEDLRLPDVQIALNEPSRLLLLVPTSLEAGEYGLRVTTQFSHGNKPLRTPRTAELATPLTIV
jgi:hypothetical protein